MTAPELQLYVSKQCRIIRRYHRKLYPQMTANEAAVIWIARYAKSFQKQWDKQRRKS